MHKLLKILVATTALMGASAVLVKPVSAEILIEAVNDHVLESFDGWVSFWVTNKGSDPVTITNAYAIGAGATVGDADDWARLDKTEIGCTLGLVLARNAYCEDRVHFVTNSPLDSGPKDDGVTPFNLRIAIGGVAYSGTAYVYVSDAPEPATWAMMLLGFGGMGAAAWRRARSAIA